MVIRRIVHKEIVDGRHIPNSNFNTKRIGFWGTVKEVDSKTNTITIVSDTGYEYPNIPVLSREWVTVDSSKSYIPSQRNLPPVDSWVFVLTPTYSISGAFVLCSGFTKGDDNIRELWSANDNEVAQKNNSRETKTQGGWDITEEYANGNFSATSNDTNIKIVANPVNDSGKEQPKEFSITAWGNHIVIDENGIKITDKNNNEISATSSGLSITDVNGNTFVSAQNKFTVSVGEDGSVVEVSNEKVTINGHLTVKAGSE